jgi:hypothetical protein
MATNVCMRFFIGTHMINHARDLDPCCISVNRLWKRKSPFAVGDWIMDSGAFTEIATHGRYRYSPARYVDEINRWADNGNLLAAVSQDYMCAPFITAKSKLSVREHQRLTVKRYEQIRTGTSVYIMPVLQGYEPPEYACHISDYDFEPGQWVGVGSVCKRNSNPGAIIRVLDAIKERRPDLRLHGFGIKLTSLNNAYIRSLLYSADSMAWSFAARKEGGNANGLSEAQSFAARVAVPPAQRLLL